MLFVEPKAWPVFVLACIKSSFRSISFGSIRIRNIVEIVQNAQPCKTQASKCPQYGGNRISSYVIEIPGGMAKKFCIAS